jgi:hypothetical protein
MKKIIIGITIVCVFILIGIVWMSKRRKSIPKTYEHFEGGAVLEGIVQCKNGFTIKLNNKIVFKSQNEDDNIYSVKIPGVKPGDIVYFYCKSNVPASQGAFLRAELNIGSMRQFYTGRDFQFIGSNLRSDNSIRGDKYAGCGIGTDIRTLQYDVGYGYNRESCREVAKNWSMPYYGLYGGGYCKVGFPQRVEIAWENREFKEGDRTYQERVPIEWENRQPFYYGNVSESNCSTQCVWDKPGENCGTSNNMSVYSINELPTPFIADVAANSKFSSTTKPMWVVGASAGVIVVTLTIPNFDILEFCPDINYEEFNAAGCENGINEVSCSVSSLVNYSPIKQLCKTPYNWTDIGAFQYLMRKVFGYLKRIPLKRGYKIANTDISMYAFSGAKNNSVPCYQFATDDPVCNPEFGQIKIDSRGGWISYDLNKGYVTINLPQLTKVYGVVTQATNFSAIPNAVTDRVLTYSVYYSANIDDKNQSSWTKVDDNIFEGNDAFSSDSALKKINFFQNYVEAVRIRISVETFLGRPGMRADIIVADDSPYKSSVDIIRNPAEAGTSAFIDLRDITNVNSIQSIKTKMDDLNKGTGFANASVYIKQFMDANYEMIILLKVIAEKIKYPIDEEQLTRDMLVLPDSPMYYNIIIKSFELDPSCALSINFKRVFKNIFMYGRLVAETPEIIRVCSCMENPVDSSKQQCAPC